MKTIEKKAGTAPRLAAGAYLAGALRRRHPDLATRVQAVQQGLVRADRLCEDLAGPLIEAHAERDVARMALGEAIRDLRHALNGRTRSGRLEGPSAELFREGLEAFARPRMPLVKTRTELLLGRIAAVLAEDDHVRVRSEATLRVGLALFAEAGECVGRAAHAADLAAIARDHARSAWDDTYQQVYGALVQRVGKVGADSVLSPTDPIRLTSSRRHAVNGPRRPTAPRVGSRVTVSGDWSLLVR